MDVFRALTSNAIDTGFENNEVTVRVNWSEYNTRSFAGWPAFWKFAFPRGFHNISSKG